MITDEALFAIVSVTVLGSAISSYWEGLSPFDALVFIVTVGIAIPFVIAFLYDRYSETSRNDRKRKEKIREIPHSLLKSEGHSILMGNERDLGIPLYLPDAIRSRHVHVLGATGSGKTESVILNFLRQDIDRGLGGIILDAKGDMTFLNELSTWVPKDRLRIFDLSNGSSLAYDPLAAGDPVEAAQRLFSSLTWSEEYYKSRAFSALQRLFQLHFDLNERNPTLTELDLYLESPKSYAAFLQNEGYPESQAIKDFSDLSGLRDQVKTLCIGHLAKILSPKDDTGMNLMDASSEKVLYFRLQSLLSPQLVSIVGKLLINHINYMAGTAHRTEQGRCGRKLVPIYLDEFAAFASPEFADLISKARSAGFALHFSHQSIGDLAEVSKGFLNQITDNSATKIVMRINDPDTSDFFARAFGTDAVKKVTQRITNTTDLDRAEIMEEGSMREVPQFRAPPDLFKRLPTGTGVVLVAHGIETPHGASTVFKIKFPPLVQ